MLACNDHHSILWRRWARVLLLCWTGWALAICGWAYHGVTTLGLMVDLMSSDRGEVIVSDPKPDFTWTLISENEATPQTAYRIRVATSKEKLLAGAKNEATGEWEYGEVDMWDSGRVESTQSVAVGYAGKPLKPNTNYYWHVQSWSNDMVSLFSQPSTFRTHDSLGPVPIPRTPQTNTPPNRYGLVESEIEPLAIRKVGEGHYFIDFGRAAFGTIQFRLDEKTSNGTIEVRLGEKAIHSKQVDPNPGGTIRYRKIDYPVTSEVGEWNRVKIPPDQRNTGKAAILMPPSIGEVMPFRYCELINVPGVLEKDDIWMIAVHYPFDDAAASFRSSDETLDAVWDLCKYTIKATTFAGIYVDGDRERIPYEADAYINQLAHYCVDREYTMARASHEYLMLNPTWPTEWILTSVLMAWEDYMYTGDLDSIRQYYDDLKAKTLIALAREDGLISVNTGRVTDEVLRSIHFQGKLKDLVDWPPASFGGDNPGERDGNVMPKVNTVVNVYHYRALVLMGRIAKALGHSADAELFEEQAAKVKAAINTKLFDAERGVYLDGEGVDHASLHPNMFALAFELVDQKRQDRVVAFVKSRGMACSVYGAQHLLDALYAAGEGQYALDLMRSTAERSWVNMIREGSTMALEAWGQKYKPNLDWNHAWGAAPANTIPRGLMGIRPLEPGFSKVEVKPQPGALEFADIKTPTIRGPVRVTLRRMSDNYYTLSVFIPGNMTAKVCLPLLGQYEVLKRKEILERVTVNGRSVSLSEYEDGFIVIDNITNHSSKFEIVMP